MTDKMTDKPPAKPAAPAAPTAPAHDSTTQAERDARFAASRGGQVILDPESDASLGARGGGGGTIEENEAVRDKGLASHDVDARDPSAAHLPENTVPAGGEVVDKSKHPAPAAAAHPKA